MESESEYFSFERAVKSIAWQLRHGSVKVMIPFQYLDKVREALKKQGMAEELIQKVVSYE